MSHDPELCLERFMGPGLVPGTSLADEALEGWPRTALAVRESRTCHLQAHLQRLIEAAAALHLPGDWLEHLGPDIEAQIGQWMRGRSATSAALRLALQPELGLLRLRLEPLPVAPQPYLLVTMPHPMAPRRKDPLLRHKGLGGSWGQAVLREARAQGASDALLLWADGSLAETAIASVGVAWNGLFWIPPPEGRVSSLAERLDLPEWAAQRGLRLEEGPLTLALARQGQVWCLNALRGLWPAQLL